MVRFKEFLSKFQAACFNFSGGLGGAHSQSASPRYLSKPPPFPLAAPPQHGELPETSSPSQRHRRCSSSAFNKYQGWASPFLSLRRPSKAKKGQSLSNNKQKGIMAKSASEESKICVYMLD